MSEVTNEKRKTCFDSLAEKGKKKYYVAAHGQTKADRLFIVPPRCTILTMCRRGSSLKNHEAVESQAWGSNQDMYADDGVTCYNEGHVMNDVSLDFLLFWPMPIGLASYAGVIEADALRQQDNLTFAVPQSGVSYDWARRSLLCKNQDAVISPDNLIERQGEGGVRAKHVPFSQIVKAIMVANLRNPVQIMLAACRDLEEDSAAMVPASREECGRFTRDQLRDFSQPRTPADENKNKCGDIFGDLPLILKNMRIRLKRGSFIAAVVNPKNDCPQRVYAYADMLRKMESRLERGDPFSYAEICQIARVCDVKNKNDWKLPLSNQSLAEVEKDVRGVCVAAQLAEVAAGEKKRRRADAAEELRRKFVRKQ